MSWHLAIDIETFYRTYGPMVYRRCRALLRDERAAEDALHDVFVNLLENRHRLDNRAPSSLLYRIATNVCLNKLRTRKRHPEDPDSQLLTRIAHAHNPHARPEARSLLGRLLQREPRSTGAMAVMHWLDGMTLEEVAAEFDMSVSGVRKRLRRLRQQLPEVAS